MLSALLITGVVLLPGAMPVALFVGAMLCSTEASAGHLLVEVPLALGVVLLGLGPQGASLVPVARCPLPVASA